ncbi:MAG: class I SAM-dependent methyltransferase [Thermoplasmata archaeon]|nr:class I SAM-dependent methyltransferase [Thermoplasmata archaeon]
MGKSQRGTGAAPVRGLRWSAALYEKGRPEYPPAAVRQLRSAMGLHEGSILLEVGSGTGKLSRSIARFPGKLVAVEPSAEMRTEFLLRLPHVRLVAGKVERLPIRRSSVDAAVVAQAFHWFPARRALREFARVLKPGAPLILLWNRRDDSLPWLKELSRLMDEYDPGVPRTGEGRWKTAFQDHPRFTALVRRRFHHLHAVDLDTLLARVISVSYMSVLSKHNQRHVAARVRALVRREGVANRAGTIVIPYSTDVYTSRLRPPRAVH